LRYLFSKLQAAISAQFPNDETIRYTCISRLIFNRFLKPAILSPNSTEDLYGESSKRKLVLIAKALQNISNLCEFGSKEEYMQSLNPFFQLYKSKMIHFLDEISKPIDCQQLKSRSSPDFEIAKDCAELVDLMTRSMKNMPDSGVLYSRMKVCLKSINDKNGENEILGQLLQSETKQNRAGSESPISNGFLSKLVSMSKSSFAVNGSKTYQLRHGQSLNNLQSVPDITGRDSTNSLQTSSPKLIKKNTSVFDLYSKSVSKKMNNRTTNIENSKPSAH
jgi:hypothetical protein